MRTLKYILAFVFISVITKAQTPKDKIEQYRIAFITKEVNLTIEESKLFWPVYNKYRDELEAIRNNNKVDLDNIDYSKLSDEEAEKKAKEIFALKQAELDIQKKYYTEFKKVLPTAKVLRLMKADADFKKQLVKLLQERRQGQR
jgi:hypothetical protein